MKFDLISRHLGASIASLFEDSSGDSDSEDITAVLDKMERDVGVDDSEGSNESIEDRVYTAILDRIKGGEAINQITVEVDGLFYGALEKGENTPNSSAFLQEIDILGPYKTRKQVLSKKIYNI